MTRSSGAGVRLGVIFPQAEIGDNPADVRRYCRGVEDLGYDRLTLYDHVLGVDRYLHPEFTGPYDIDAAFHEPLVLLGYAAAITTRIELATGILVLPQRQAALAAKQAAEVDLLSGERLVLGIGAGWNDLEFAALGCDFSTRGARLDEQIQLLRALWTRRTVNHCGQFESVYGLGLAPRPRRSIPIWIGARSDPAYRRVGRTADGWFPRVSPGPKFDAACRAVAEAAEVAGRDPAAIGMDCRLAWSGDLPALLERAEFWWRHGATHLSVETTKAGLADVEEHLAVLAELAAALRSQVA